MKTKIEEYGTRHDVEVIHSEEKVVAVRAFDNNEGYILIGHGLDPLPKVGDKGHIIFERNNLPTRGHWQFYADKKENLDFHAHRNNEKKLQ